MITAATRAMNASSHTLGDLRTFAQAEPAEAQAYLESVKQTLVASGRQVPAPIEALLAGPADQLDARIQAQSAQLAPYFPDQPEQWGQLQAQRAQTIGWTAGAPPALLAVTGRLGGDGTTLTLVSGTTYKLSGSTRASGLEVGWLRGFSGDGDVPFTVRGTIAADGKTFLVEDYSPGSSPNFVTGRVDGATPGTIRTVRGWVRIADPTFATQLMTLPRLGVILPGAPVEENGELVYKGKPEAFYALGRFNTFPGAGTARNALLLAQQELAATAIAITTFSEWMPGQLERLAKPQLVAASPAETAALANLAALDAALQAAVAAQVTALQLYTQAPGAGAAANAPQAFADAQAAATAAAQRVTEALQAVTTAQQALGTMNPQWSEPLSQRSGVASRMDKYQSGITSRLPDLAAARGTLAQAEAAAAVPQPALSPDAVVTGATGDFALSRFSGKPINIRGEKEASRANHTDRMWALGSFTFDAQGWPQSFEATYVSLPLGDGKLTAERQLADADDWLGALAVTQAGVTTGAAPPVSADFARHTP